ncbi:EpsG family protein [Candidatus Saccharibacteria bacterium]|nr:EpsG family protein [Candidatus Saccharibacteria bacterium]
MTIFYIFLVILLVAMPLLGLFASIPFYLRAKKPVQKITFSILLGVLVGFFAYHLVPEPNFDIVRHQAITERYMAVDTIDGFFDLSTRIDLEIIPQFYSFLISKTGNLDLLQFFVVTAGFSMLFYILIDYKNKKELELKHFIPIFVVALFAQSLIYYFSGLYNYFAMSLFAFAFYLDYIKNRKVAPYILYVLLIFIHNSMLFPVLLLALYKICGNKINIKTCVIFVGGAVLVPLILTYLVDSLGVTSLDPIRTTLNAYMTRNDDFSKFYTDANLIMDVLQYATVAITCFITRNNKENKKFRDFTILFMISSGLMLINSIVFIRFFSLVLYLGLIPMMDAIKNRAKGFRYLIAAICVTAVVSAVINIHKLYPYGYNKLVQTRITSGYSKFMEKS